MTINLNEITPMETVQNFRPQESNFSLFFKIHLFRACARTWKFTNLISPKSSNSRSFYKVGFDWPLANHFMFSIRIQLSAEGLFSGPYFGEF